MGRLCSTCPISMDILSLTNQDILSAVEGYNFMPWLYILKCIDGSYYTGTTGNPERRLAEHMQGIPGSYTYNRQPVELVFSEEFPSWPETIEREFQIKGWSRRKKQALINSDWNTLHTLAKRKTG